MPESRGSSGSLGSRPLTDQTQRTMIYCVIPPELEDELFEKLTEYYGNPNVKVIVDRRRALTGVEARRQAGSARLAIAAALARPGPSSRPTRPNRLPIRRVWRNASDGTAGVSSNPPEIHPRSRLVQTNVRRGALRGHRRASDVRRRR